MNRGGFWDGDCAGLFWDTAVGVGRVPLIHCAKPLLRESLGVDVAGQLSPLATRIAARPLNLLDDDGGGWCGFGLGLGRFLLGVAFIAAIEARRAAILLRALPANLVLVVSGAEAVLAVRASNNVLAAVHPNIILIVLIAANCAVPTPVVWLGSNAAFGASWLRHCLNYGVGSNTHEARWPLSRGGG